MFYLRDCFFPPDEKFPCYNDVTVAVAKGTESGILYWGDHWNIYRGRAPPMGLDGQRHPPSVWRAALFQWWVKKLSPFTHFLRAPKRLCGGRNDFWKTGGKVTALVFVSWGGKIPPVSGWAWPLWENRSHGWERVRMHFLPLGCLAG